MFELSSRLVGVYKVNHMVRYTYHPFSLLSTPSPPLVRDGGGEVGGSVELGTES